MLAIVWATKSRKHLLAPKHWVIWGFPQIKGTIFWGAYTCDCNISGVFIGVTHLRGPGPEAIQILVFAKYHCVVALNPKPREFAVQSMALCAPTLMGNIPVCLLLAHASLKP